MKYRVKQDYPKKVNEPIFIIPKGTIVENNIASFNTHKVNISNKELEILTDWFEKIEEPKFKAGDWVWNPILSCIVRLTGDPIDPLRYDNGSNGITGIICSENDKRTISQIRLATFEEIKTHLIEEARRRGFKVGVTVNFFDGSIDKIRPILPGYSYYETDDVFSFMGWIIYKEGEWAEIIKEKIMVGKYDVLFRDGCIQVGCKTYNVFEVSNLLATMDGLNINSIEIEGVKVPFETVKKIAERFQ